MTYTGLVEHMHRSITGCRIPPVCGHRGVIHTYFSHKHAGAIMLLILMRKISVSLRDRDSFGPPNGRQASSRIFTMLRYMTSNVLNTVDGV